MRSAVGLCRLSPYRGPWRRGRAAAVAWCLWFAGWLVLAPAAPAAELQFAAFDVKATDEGVMLNYAVNFELPRSVDDALNKAVPLFFMAEASIFHDRWYWRDRRVAHAVRVWRIVFQPLTSTYRVTFGGLSQNYPSRNEALAAISRGVGWKLAEPGQLDGGPGHYLEFKFRLDTSQLPRPMQIGIDGQPDWDLAVERRQRID